MTEFEIKLMKEIALIKQENKFLETRIRYLENSISDALEEQKERFLEALQQVENKLLKREERALDMLAEVLHSLSMKLIKSLNEKLEKVNH